MLTTVNKFLNAILKSLHHRQCQYNTSNMYALNTKHVLILQATVTVFIRLKKAKYENYFQKNNSFIYKPRTTPWKSLATVAS